MRTFGIPQIEDESMALAAALSYWCFKCRDRQKSPAMGLKTWEFLQNSIANAAIPARGLDEYIEFLSRRLIVPSLKPKEWTLIISPNQRIQRVDIETGEIFEYTDDQFNDGLRFESWHTIMKALKQKGITDAHILHKARQYPHIVTTFVRVRYEEDKAIGLEDNTIEVEANV